MARAGAGSSVGKRQSILAGSLDDEPAPAVDPDDVGRPPAPLERCPWWSLLSFAWLNPLIKLGNQRVLEETDLPALARADRVERLQDLVLVHWARELKVRPEAPRLWRALLGAFVPLNLAAYPLYALASLARILQAVLGMKGLVDALDNPERPGARREAYTYAVVILVTGLLNFLLLHQVQFMGWRLGLWMRTATEAAIFKKVLRMPLSAFDEMGEEAALPRAGGSASVTTSSTSSRAQESEHHLEEEGDDDDDGNDAAEQEEDNDDNEQGQGQEQEQEEEHGDDGAHDSKEQEPDAYHQSITPGLVMNMATTDVDRFQRIGSLIHYLIFAPLDIAIVSACGAKQTGPTFLIGVAVLLLLIPTQALMANTLQRVGKRASVLTDKRVRLTKQTIEGARAIKLGGWEPLAEARIRGARAAEMVMLRWAGALRGLNDGLYFLSPVLVGAAVFMLDWAMGRELGPGRVFTTLTLFGILQWNAVYMGGRAIQSLNELWVSVHRLEHLFRMPELPAHRIAEASVFSPRPAVASPPPAPAPIRVRRLSFNYHGSHSKEMPALRQVSFSAAPGAILGVVGPIGSGKSTLLKALLGELGHADRKRVLDVGPGPIAYAAQEPWILTASVRENVVVGRPFDPDRYRAVLKAACLAPDLEEWEHGDQTIVGDRGVNLSGGQKARLGLARMAYGEATLYLIDDALSALDPQVGRRVFNRLILGLLGGKTRVIATHQLQYLIDASEVPRVLFLSRGKLRAHGTMAELLAQGWFRDVQLRRQQSLDAMASPTEGPGKSPIGMRLEEMEDEEARDAEEEAAEDAFLCSLVDDCLHVAAEIAHASSRNTNTLTAAERKAAAERASIISRERRAAGSVGASSFAAYVEGMGGVCAAIGVLLLMCSGQLAAIFSNLQLSRWVKLPYDEQQRPTAVVGYLTLVGVVSVLAVARALVASNRMLRAAQTLHDGMIHSLLRTPIAFYDTNPTGRIINRTTKDVLTLDVALPTSLYAFVQMALICLGTVGVVVSVNPWLVLLLVPLVLVFLPLRRQFLNTARETRRLESIASSPVYSLLSEAMAGLPTIRSLGAVDLFEREFVRRLNGYSRPFFIFFSAGRHLGFRLDVLCWVLTSATAFASLASTSPSSGVSGWLIGMSLMYVLQLAGVFQWTVRQFADVENEVVAVERVKEYCLLPPEAALDSVPGHAPPPGWPDRGAIVARDLEVAYRPGLPPVLHGLTFSIEGGQRVGIVGRTGSGKTTLLQALFRLMEPCGGRLEIDGVDVATIGLHDLRCRLAIVAQDPFLFSGTLRQTLDPLGIHDDAEIWAALRAVQMEDDVRVMGIDVTSRVPVLVLRSPSPRSAAGPGPAVPSFADQEHPLSALERARSAAASAAASSSISRDPSASSLGDLGDERDSNSNISTGGAPGSVGPGLDLEVTENGANFSQGQKQLLCLARAILQRARILVLDEATANVDLTTDRRIQAAVRERFPGTTVLNVAHRINTIIDADQVLVLAAGRLVEAGPPHLLLNTPLGLPLGQGGLRDMVHQTGPETEAALRRAARVAWEARRPEESVAEAAVATTRE